MPVKKFQDMTETEQKDFLIEKDKEIIRIILHSFATNTVCHVSGIHDRDGRYTSRKALAEKSQAQIFYSFAAKLFLAHENQRAEIEDIAVYAAGLNNPKKSADNYYLQELSSACQLREIRRYGLPVNDLALQGALLLEMMQENGYAFTNPDAQIWMKNYNWMKSDTKNLPIF